MSKSEPISSLEIERMGITPVMLSELVHSRRVALGLTKKAFASRLHVHLSTVSRWERGLFDPTFVRLANLIFGLNRSGTGTDPMIEYWMRRAINAERLVTDIRTRLDVPLV